MPEKQLGKIHIYTGDGKGKTTAALGLAIRALGYNFKVGIIYFDKGGDYYNERKILDKLKNEGIIYKAFGEARVRDKGGFRFQNIPEDISGAKKAIGQASQWFKEDFDLLILDEINTSVKTGLLQTEEIIALLKQKPASLELVLTGRYAPPEILAYGDLVTNMTMVKHYISQGLSARPGIDY